MTPSLPGSSRPIRRLIVLSAALLALALAVTAVVRRPRPGPTPSRSAPGLPAAATREASHAEVVQVCGVCHPYPPPDTFPKADWPREVRRGFEFLGRARRPFEPPPVETVTAYYQNRAPEELPRLDRPGSRSPLPVRFERLAIRQARSPGAPGVANVRLVHLSDEKQLDVVACDMINGKVFLGRPDRPGGELRLVTAAIPNPAHAEVVDLDRDGTKDLLVANLGSPIPTEQRVGSVVWLKGRPDGSFTPVTLADELGRVADVQAADFDGDGDLDLIVAVFGRLTLGETLLLENRTTDPDRPAFARTTVDPRHGPIHVPVADLNGDGRPDFVALISQEHETVVAFLNRGDLHFEPRVIYAAPHPAFGSSGVQLVDLDRDGDLDVLMTNGDTLDSSLLRPYHGISWLENRGSYPFVEHHLASLYGVHRAVAADLDGDGDLDIAATTFLPGPYYQRICRLNNLDAVVVLEQDAPGRFVYHPIESGTCDHATVDLGDVDDDGDIDLVTANFFMPPEPPRGDGSPPSDDWVILYRNLGPPR